MRHLFRIMREPSDAQQTLGQATLYDGLQKVFECKTLELDWQDNEPRQSCIPKGRYTCKPYSSPKYPNVYQVMNVPGRSYILIHSGNYHTDILGCILVGSAHTDINGDGYKDVVSSKNTLDKIRSIIGNNEFELVIE